MRTDRVSMTEASFGLPMYFSCLYICIGTFCTEPCR